jgi:hypothetical protein
MFVAIGLVATLMAFWREVLIFLAICFAATHLWQIVAAPVRFGENTVGDSSRVERTFEVEGAGYRVNIWNRSDKIIRRVEIACETGNSHTSMLDILPGQTYEEWLPTEHTNARGCVIEWDFIKPRGQYR